MASGNRPFCFWPAVTIFRSSCSRLIGMYRSSIRAVSRAGRRPGAPASTTYLMSAMFWWCCACMASRKAFASAFVRKSFHLKTKVVGSHQLETQGAFGRPFGFVMVTIAMPHFRLGCAAPPVGRFAPGCGSGCQSWPTGGRVVWRAYWGLLVSPQGRYACGIPGDPLRQGQGVAITGDAADCLYSPSDKWCHSVAG